MRYKNFLSVISAISISFSAVSMNLCAEAADIADESVQINPVCEHINQADINRTLYISIPKDADAKVDIVYNSPEFNNHEYYSTALPAGGIYSFDIEGRDTTEDDYRDYTLTVTLTGGKYNLTSDIYTHKFNVPDGNDNPDSYSTVIYDFTVDDVVSENSFTVTKDDENEKKIAVHLNAVAIGDVNMDNSVNASDASLILTEYALISTGNTATFTLKQKDAADVNGDKEINAIDASLVLAYYAHTSTGGTLSIEDFIANKS